MLAPPVPLPSASSDTHNQAASPAPWFVYILKCRDNSLYTGVTTDLVRRLEEHNSITKSAKYTRSRQPITLVYSESASSRREACRREFQIKQMSRVQKQSLIDREENQAKKVK